MRQGGVATAFLGLMLAAVSMQTWAEASLAVIAIAIVAFLTLRAKVRALAVRLRPFAYFAVIALCFGGLGGDDPVFSLGPLHWSGATLERAGIAAARLMALGAAVGWLTLFMGTSTLLGHVWRLSDRLRKLGIDLSALLVGLAVAVRFLPLLQDEAVRLRWAWEARGAGLLGWTPMGRIRYVTGLIVPILAAALRRAEDFALAVELRSGRLGGWQQTSSTLSAALAPPPPTSSLPMRRKGSQGVILAMSWMPMAYKILSMLG